MYRFIIEFVISGRYTPLKTIDSIMTSTIGTIGTSMSVTGNPRLIFPAARNTPQNSNDSVNALVNVGNLTCRVAILAVACKALDMPLTVKEFGITLSLIKVRQQFQNSPFPRLDGMLTFSHYPEEAQCGL